MDELRQDLLLIRLWRYLLHALLQPLPMLGVGDVHELRGDGAAVVAAGVFRYVAFGSGCWEWFGR